VALAELVAEGPEADVPDYFPQTPDIKHVIELALARPCGSRRPGGLSNNDNLLLTATKMKDAEAPAPLGLELATVDLPGVVDDYGNPVTSAAIEVLDADTCALESQAKAIRPRGKWQDVGFTAARRLIVASDNGQVAIDAWRDECKEAGMIPQNQHRVLDALIQRGEVIVTDGALSLPTF